MIGVLAQLDPVSEIAAHELFSFSVGGYKVVFSNHMLMIFVASVFLMITIPFAFRRRLMVKSGLANFIEVICLYIREEIARPFLEEKTDKYIGFLWTLFFFIITLNLSGLVPFEKIFSLILNKPVHIGGAATANIWVTGALAAVSAIMIHVSGIRSQGFLPYFKNFAPPVPILLKPFIYLIEFLSSLIKPFALAVRLFANIFAGHVLLAVILSFAVMFKNIGVASGAIGFAIIMSFLELFVSCLQAYVFVFLTTIFISFAVAGDH